MLTVWSPCYMHICNFSYFPFGLEGRILVPIEAVPCHCLRFAFRNPNEHLLVCENFELISPKSNNSFRFNINFSNLSNTNISLKHFSINKSSHHKIHNSQ